LGTNFGSEAKNSKNEFGL